MGELLQSGTFGESVGLIIFLGVVAGGSSVFLLVTLNFVMARYEQLDALPIYQSFNMCMTILCGLILLGEADHYTTAKLVGLSLAVLTIVIGILVLGFKKTKVSTEKRKPINDQATTESVIERNSRNLDQSEDSQAFI